MTMSVALLRAVNVGGTKKLPMADLCKMFAKLGHTNVKSLLASGQVVFSSTITSSAKLEKALESELKTAFAIDTDIFVRTTAEWDAIVAANPFTEEAVNDPAHLYVMVTRDQVTAASVKGLQAVMKGREQVRLGKHCIYLTYPDGTGESKLTNTVIERALGTRGTARNWNTTNKIAAALSS